MEEYRCPKCNEHMDEGHISWAGSGATGYVSKKQTGMFRRATAIQLARVCMNCGYVELYLDPNELKKNIS
jgi:predicted nucleic-acid-binding Zn-ribbon protein